MALSPILLYVTEKRRSSAARRSISLQLTNTKVLDVARAIDRYIDQRITAITAVRAMPCMGEYVFLRRPMHGLDLSNELIG